MPSAPPRRENLFVNLLCNLLAPIFILSKLSSDERLGSQWALVLALAFPIGYGAYDYYLRKKVNLISLLGIANALITGLVGLLELDGLWIIAKETSIPALIGLFVLLSMKTDRPLVKTFIYNDQVIDVEKIERELDRRDNKPAFNKLFEQCSYIMAFSFLVSAILNFVVAKIIVVSPGGTEEFNQQIAKMTWVSYIVIFVPSTLISFYAMWKLFSGIRQLTGIRFVEAVHGASESDASQP